MRGLTVVLVCICMSCASRQTQQQPQPVPTETASSTRIELVRGPGTDVDRPVACGDYLVSAFGAFKSQYAYRKQLLWGLGNDSTMAMLDPSSAKDLLTPHLFLMVQFYNASRVPQPIPAVWMLDSSGSRHAPIFVGDEPIDAYSRLDALNPGKGKMAIVVFDLPLTLEAQYSFLVNANGEERSIDIRFELETGPPTARWKKRGPTVIE